MGAQGSKEKLQRSASERFVTSTQVQQHRLIERERFGSFGKRVKDREGTWEFLIYQFNELKAEVLFMEQKSLN